ncbi:hypothetical protein [Rubripirellula tenax]|nr:hypothetical protein [Rubripirellula tenax]
MSGSIAAIYSAPDSAWFSIYAGPSKFQRLTPTILLLDTGEDTVHIHVLKADGLIPADHIAVARSPGTRRAPDPVRLQIASSSMPQTGNRCTVETFKSDHGLIYAVKGTLRVLDTATNSTNPKEPERTEP